MSHGDELDPKSINDFKVIATTKNSVAAIANPKKKIYGVQFHPEVSHTEKGEKILLNFITKIAKLKLDWNMPSFIEMETEKIRKQIGNKKVILALSGGVDSSVLAVFLHRIIKDQLLCVFIDNGLLRYNEAKEVVAQFRKHFLIPLKYVNARKIFLKKLRWVSNPERKRRVIGKLFIKILKKESKGFYYLAQGTLYPDVIESVSPHGHSQTIKTHHNRVKQVLKMQAQGRLVEPFQQLFKDEVREIGKKFGLPDSIIHRQPFPGPGLAVRIIGRVTLKRLVMLRKVDWIFQKKLMEYNQQKNFWQSFAVLLPVKSVGVVGDRRSYGYTAVLRAVSSLDGMTADFEILSKEELTEVANEIVGRVEGIARVVWDITSKPPATIEWE
ncbi:GMP synthase [glutamine-hydrolyzing]-like [Ylistrum balloti]|uniref:GMP synthase [glutamine-hydrolyzing]-like n=1 Tax=Ylistrum balloti TaxID=509963 RepID=UPI002905BC4B|nr:GMP synthase [glutamine-hydrolyzing]-like [Ylistrum balloti]